MFSLHIRSIFFISLFDISEGFVYVQFPPELCSEYSVFNFTTNVPLVCAKECINNIMCQAFSIHKNEDNTLTQYTCELYPNITAVTGIVDSTPNPSSTCFGMLYLYSILNIIIYIILYRKNITRSIS